MFGCLFTVATMGVGIAAGLHLMSFWWVLAPAFIAASFLLSNGPGFGTILRANKEGRLGVFPAMLAFNMLPQLAIAGIAYFVTSRFFGG